MKNGAVPARVVKCRREPRATMGRVDRLAHRVEADPIARCRGGMRAVALLKRQVALLWGQAFRTCGRGSGRRDEYLHLHAARATLLLRTDAIRILDREMKHRPAARARDLPDLPDLDVRPYRDRGARLAVPDEGGNQLCHQRSSVGIRGQQKVIRRTCTHWRAPRRATAVQSKRRSGRWLAHRRR